MWSKTVLLQLLFATAVHSAPRNVRDANPTNDEFKDNLAELLDNTREHEKNFVENARQRVQSISKNVPSRGSDRDDRPVDLVIEDSRPILSEEDQNDRGFDDNRDEEIVEAIEGSGLATDDTGLRRSIEEGEPESNEEENEIVLSDETDDEEEMDDEEDDRDDEEEMDGADSEDINVNVDFIAEDMEDVLDRDEDEKRLEILGRMREKLLREDGRQSKRKFPLRDGSKVRRDISEDREAVRAEMKEVRAKLREDLKMKRVKDREDMRHSPQDEDMEDALRTRREDREPSRPDKNNQKTSTRTESEGTKGREEEKMTRTKFEPGYPREDTEDALRTRRGDRDSSRSDVQKQRTSTRTESDRAKGSVKDDRQN